MRKLKLLLILLFPLFLASCHITVNNDDDVCTLNVWNDCDWKLNMQVESFLYFDHKSIKAHDSEKFKLEPGIKYEIRLTSAMDEEPIILTEPLRFTSGYHSIKIEWNNFRQKYVIKTLF